MMKRVAIVILLVGMLSACASAGTPQPAGQTPPAGQGQATSQPVLPSAGGADGASLAEAALKVKDWCTLMPTDLAAKLIPGASAPQSQLFIPLKCTVSNQVSVLEITFLSGVSTDPVAGAESIPGLAQAAYFERLLPDDAYLTVILDGDSGAVLYVEVAGNDGKDHRDDAIALAQAVIAKLH